MKIAFTSCVMADGVHYHVDHVVRHVGEDYEGVLDDVIDLHLTVEEAIVLALVLS